MLEVKLDASRKAKDFGVRTAKAMARGSKMAVFYAIQCSPLRARGHRHPQRAQRQGGRETCHDNSRQRVRTSELLETNLFDADAEALRYGTMVVKAIKSSPSSGHMHCVYHAIQAAHHGRLALALGHVLNDRRTPTVMTRTASAKSRDAEVQPMYRDVMRYRRHERRVHANRVAGRRKSVEA